MKFGVGREDLCCVTPGYDNDESGKRVATFRRIYCLHLQGKREPVLEADWL
jgi:hypothetical protein